LENYVSPNLYGLYNMTIDRALHIGTLVAGILVSGSEFNIITRVEAHGWLYL